MKFSTIIHPLAIFCTFTNAYKLSMYGGKSCRGQNLGSREMKVDGGCQKDLAGNAASVVITPDENSKDFGNVVVFFDGDDCKPSNIMQSGAAFVYEDGYWTGNYGSYEVWDLWKVEGMGVPEL